MAKKKPTMKEILKKLNSQVHKETQMSLRGGMRTTLNSYKKKKRKR